MRNDLPESLQKLIAHLKDTEKLNNVKVSAIVESVGLKHDKLQPYVSFAHGKHKSYGKNLVWDNGNFKVYLMAWRPGDFTAIHNHGLTDWGCVCFFGDTEHRLYELKDDKLVLCSRDTMKNGQTAAVTGNLTHMMGNAGKENVFTLHIYGNNTGGDNVSDDSEVFLPESGRVVTTCGSAYLNMDPSVIRTEEEFDKFSRDVLIDYYLLVRPFFERNNLLSSLRSIEERINV